jgi:hypothetical protein
MFEDDARYERACRLLLAVAAGIHWVCAGIVWHSHRLAQVEAIDVYAWVTTIAALIV